MIEALVSLHIEEYSTALILYDAVRFALCLPILGLSLIWLRYLWKYRKVTIAASKLPTIIYRWPFIGHLYLLVNGASSMLGVALQILKRAAADNIKTIAIWLGPCPLVFVLDAKEIHKVLTGSKTADKSIEYRFIHFAVGNGLLTAPNVLFGNDVKVDTTSEQFRDLHRAVDNIARVAMERIVQPWLWSETLFKLLKKKEIDGILNSWSTFLEELLKNRQFIKLRKKDINTIDDTTLPASNPETDVGPQSPLSLLDTYDTLTEKFPDFTDKYLLNEIITIVTAGTDSSKSALSACLMALATYPDVQERLYQEVVSVVGAEDSDVTPQDLSRMPYLDQVFKEAVRVFSVIPLIARHVKEELKLKDVTLPAGSSVVVPLVGLHFDPAVYPKPETFDPDRFSPENVAKMERYTFQPFSSGTRNCIGKGYADIFLKTSVIHTLRQYRLSTSVEIHKLRYSVAFATVSEDGYFMELQPRKPQN